MADRLEKITYQENPDVLAWLDTVAERVSAYRDGANVSRADVIRWLTRRGRAHTSELPVHAIASEI